MASPSSAGGAASAVSHRPLGHSVRGASHVRQGQPNQDAWLVSERPGALVLAVSDGHGGARHWRSARGAELGVEVAARILHEMAKPLAAQSLRDAAATAAAQLPVRIVEAWRDRVRDELDRDPIGSDELNAVAEAEGDEARASVLDDPWLAYGATLLAGLRLADRIVLCQIGDGDILMVDNTGHARRPLATDDRLSGNLTTSLCRPQAAADFRCAVIGTVDDPMPLLLLATDGYANSFQDDEGFLKVGTDFLALFRQHGVEAVASQLPTILEHVSSHGSGDDVTVAMMVSTAAAGPAAESPNGTVPADTQPQATPQTRPAADPSKGRLARQRLLAVTVLMAALAAAAWTQRHRFDFAMRAPAASGPGAGDGAPGIQWTPEVGRSAEPAASAPAVTTITPAVPPAKPASGPARRPAKETNGREGSWPSRPPADTKPGPAASTPPVRTSPRPEPNPAPP